MEIIPVIDIMGGKVVHATGGERTSYLPLKSVLTESIEPITVINNLLVWYPFTTVYIADLDAIEQQKDNRVLYQQLVRMFPEVNFWLDAGARTQRCLQKLSDYSNITPVMASETFSDSKYLLSCDSRGSIILSLDFKDGVLLGDISILKQTAFWPERIIVMDLDSVGKQAGPNIQHLLEFKKKAGKHQLIAAGGIRNKVDVDNLASHGIKHALVASALHNGSIIRSELDKI